MMKKHQISQDDLFDVIEMTQKLEDGISRVLSDNQVSLCMSALMNATVNCIILQCDTVEEIIQYKNAFFEVFENIIHNLGSQNI